MAMATEKYFSQKIRLGEHLLKAGLLTQAKLSETLALQKETGLRLGDILVQRKVMSAYKFYNALANYYQIDFIDLFQQPPDNELMLEKEGEYYRQYQFVPWRKKYGTLYVALYDLTKEVVTCAQKLYGEEVGFVLTSKFDMMWHLNNHSLDEPETEVDNTLKFTQRFIIKQRLGEHLVEKGHITEVQLDEALILQKEHGERLGDVILAQNWMSSYQFYSVLAEHQQRPFINLLIAPPDVRLLNIDNVDGYLKYQLIPWRVKNNVTFIALYDCSPQAIEFCVSVFGENIEFVITSKFDIIWYLQNNAQHYFSDETSGNATSRLLKRFTTKHKIGDHLVSEGLLSKEMLQAAIQLQKDSKLRLGELILEQGWISAYKFYSALAAHHQRPFVNLMETPPDSALIEVKDINDYIQHQMLPWKKKEHTTYIALYDPTPQAIEFAVQRFGEKIDFVITSKFDLMWYLQNNSEQYFNENSSLDLATRMGKRFATKHRLGDYLVNNHFISSTQLAQAIQLQKQWGSRLGDIILAKGWVNAYSFYNALAEHHQRPFINLMLSEPDTSLYKLEDLDAYIAYKLLPWRRKKGVTYIAMYDPTPQAIEFSVSRFGENIDFVITSKFDIMWQLQKYGDAYFSENAVNGLAKRMPEQSAVEVFTIRQIAFLGVLGFVLITCTAIWPIATISLINLLIAIFLLLNFGLRWLFTWVGSERSIDMKITQHMIDSLDEHELPVYTVLVPMYKEPETLPILSNALRNMDYPISKLDIKLVLEADDDETIEAAKKLGLEAIFEIIRVPPSLPKTKPKACNYALSFSHGEYVTIFDAEDKPEPDQLKKVVAAFKAAPENTVCMQCRLNYFNATENWLTRMFTLEYSLWFDFYLPALETLKIPIPLGGTSNHFKMSVLKEVHAWDPYNVTEDADLGVRITQLGNRVGVVNSTTYEEANTSFGNWIRQRSRWIKGYMQTYLVHMRKPIEFYKSLGHVGFWGFQFFIGGTILSALLPPILYAIFFIWLYTSTHAFDVVFPAVVLYISLINLLIGNGFFIYISGLGAFKRKNYKLIPYCLTVPVYWIMMSIAGYKALWQLIHNPFYWEKTTHGLSNFNHEELTESKSSLP